MPKEIRKSSESSDCRRLEKQAVYYFYVVVCILLLAFLESVREMQKFAERDQNMKVRIEDV